MMPVMDGLTLCRRIKEDPKTSHIPIILLTARKLDENKVEGIRMGADSYLTKPFDIELLDARRAPSVPPPDVAAPPADAIKTASGLMYKVIKPGTGTLRPTARDSVTVHYTGWTTDGKVFDSTVAKGMPVTLELSKVIRGWTEGMQLMVEGERTRFWIPQDLAYKGEAGSPKGMLVFDIDLIRIE